MNLAVIAENLPLYGRGLLTTLGLLVASLAGGLIAALPLAVLRASRQRWLSAPVWAYTYVIRGTPLLVQLFLLYYGLAQFEAVRNSVAWPLLSSAWFCAVLAFALNTCAYTTEMLAGPFRPRTRGRSRRRAAWA